MIMEAKKAYTVVLCIQMIYAGMFLISKVAFDVGMDTYVFVFYRQAMATLFLAPLAFFFKGGNAPSLSFVILCKIFMLSLVGITLSLNLYGVALTYTSASLAAATTNCLPVITFLLAVILRMESVKLRTTSGIAKVAGITVCVAGVLTIALYRGPYLKSPLDHPLIGHHNTATTDQHHAASNSSGETWIKGCCLMLFSNSLFGLWLVIQAWVLTSYPAKLLLTTLQCFFSSIQSFLLAIAMQRDPQQWKLGWNIRLLSVAYCGIVVTGFTYYLQTWVVEKKGPVFLAMSTPVSMILTILISTFFLGQTIALGSVLGGVLLIGGLYFVLWGKHKEQKNTARDVCPSDEIERQQIEFVESKEEIPSKNLPCHIV